MVETKDLAKLSRDLYNGKEVVFDNGNSGEKVLRNVIFEALGTKDGEKINYYKFQENKHKFFQIISVAVDAALPTVLTNELDGLAEVRNINHGDEVKFDFEDNGLFRVGLVASGTRDLRRQELVGGSFTIDTDWYGVKVYAELEKFLAGHVNWRAYIDRVARSFSQFIQSKIHEAFVDSYDALRATRKQEGAYDEDQLLELVDHIAAAAGGRQTAIYGTRSALRKISKDDKVLHSDGMKDQINKVGYLGTLAGVPLIALPNAYKAGTEEFALDKDTLLILPQNEKLVSVAFEGQTLAREGSQEERNDMQIEFETLRKLGVQVAQSAVYGMYKFS